MNKVSFILWLHHRDVAFDLPNLIIRLGDDDGWWEEGRLFTPLVKFLINFVEKREGGREEKEKKKRERRRTN